MPKAGPTTSWSTAPIPRTSHPGSPPTVTGGYGSVGYAPTHRPAATPNSTRRAELRTSWRTRSSWPDHDEPSEVPTAEPDADRWLLRHRFPARRRDVVAAPADPMSDLRPPCADHSSPGRQRGGLAPQRTARGMLCADITEVGNGVRQADTDRRSGWRMPRCQRAARGMWRRRRRCGVGHHHRRLFPELPRPLTPPRP